MIDSTSTASNRAFIYEVAGLHQNQQTEKNSYPVRSSSNIFIQVPFNRMNEQMQSIVRSGGTIVSIRPLNEFLEPSNEPSDQEN
jgi:phycocyanin-associated, rod